MNTAIEKEQEVETVNKTEEVKASAVMTDDEVNQISESADNDNGGGLTPPPASKSKWSQEQMDEAVKVYGLSSVIYKTLPPKKYMAAGVKSVEISIQKLKYDKILQGILKNMPSRQGSRKLPGKQELVENLYGLNRYYREQIEKADFTYMDEAIQIAREKNTTTDINKMMKLKEEAEREKREEERQAAKEAEEAEWEAKLEEYKVADPEELFDVALVDLTAVPKTVKPSLLNLPLADDSVLLVAVRPQNIQEALGFIQSQQAKFVDELIWDKENITPRDWCQNRHISILIATKGNPDVPHKTSLMPSVALKKPVPGDKRVHEYYYKMIKEMCPGKQYLEVFSNRHPDDSWYIYESETEKGEN